ncbi:MAG: hypothetical protein LBH62_02490 [Nitrososphaerota archaeon]|jgi:hypothetical protein|nr:hypothetical protein [Nitrososphaerota archaeon]
MNTKQFSTIGICLALIAVISMIAMPALVSAETPASINHNRTQNCHCGKGSVTVSVTGYYDTSNPSTFTSTSANWVVSGSVVKTSFTTVPADTIIWAKFLGTCTYCGRTVECIVWVSPPTFNPFAGDSGRCF